MYEFSTSACVELKPETTVRLCPVFPRRPAYCLAGWLNSSAVSEATLYAECSREGAMRVDRFKNPWVTATGVAGQISRRNKKLHFSNAKNFPDGIPTSSCKFPTEENFNVALTHFQNENQPKILQLWRNIFQKDIPTIFLCLSSSTTTLGTAPLVVPTTHNYKE